MTATPADLPDEVVEAAAIKIAYGTDIPDERAVGYWHDLPRYEQARHLARATAALLAAQPLWEAHLRSRIKAEIERQRVPYSLQETAGRCWAMGQDTAARIAGGEG